MNMMHISMCAYMWHGLCMACACAACACAWHVCTIAGGQDGQREAPDVLGEGVERDLTHICAACACSMCM